MADGQLHRKYFNGFWTMIIKDSSAFGDTGTVCLVEKLQRLITKHLNTAAPACSVALWEITNALKVPGGRVKGYWSYLSENLAKNVLFFFWLYSRSQRSLRD